MIRAREVLAKAQDAELVKRNGQYLIVSSKVTYAGRYRSAILGVYQDVNKALNAFNGSSLVHTR